MNLPIPGLTRTGRRRPRPSLLDMDLPAPQAGVVASAGKADAAGQIPGVSDAAATAALSRIVAAAEGGGEDKNDVNASIAAIAQGLAAVTQSVTDLTDKVKALTDEKTKAAEEDEDTTAKAEGGGEEDESTTAKAEGDTKKEDGEPVTASAYIASIKAAVPDADGDFVTMCCELNMTPEASAVLFERVGQSAHPARPVQSALGLAGAAGADAVQTGEAHPFWQRVDVVAAEILSEDKSLTKSAAKDKAKGRVIREEPALYRQMVNQRDAVKQLEALGLAATG